MAKKVVHGVKNASSEKYSGDTERQVEDSNKSWNEEGGTDYPKEYKKKSDKVSYAKDTEGERFKETGSNYDGHYLPYGERGMIYDKVDDGEEGGEHSKSFYLPKIGEGRNKPVSLSKIAKSRRE